MATHYYYIKLYRNYTKDPVFRNILYYNSYQNLKNYTWYSISVSWYGIMAAEFECHLISHNKANLSALLRQTQKNIN